MNGLSERSARRFCAPNGIRRYVDIHNVVTPAIAEVIVASLHNVFCLALQQAPSRSEQ